MNIAELAINALERYGEYESLYFEGDGRWYTNKQLDDRTQQVAAGLTDLCVKKGARVAELEEQNARIEERLQQVESILGALAKAPN